MSVIFLVFLQLEKLKKQLMAIKKYVEISQNGIYTYDEKISHSESQATPKALYVLSSIESIKTS